MNAADHIREEEHFREVERVMLHVDEAARKATKAAETLKGDGASPHLVNALDTAAGALRAEHKRLVQSVYWNAPEPSAQGQLASADENQERLVS